LKEKVPFLVRAFVFQDRLLSLVVLASAMIRVEMLWVWTSPRDRDRANRAIYADQINYFPGGSTFEQGLLDWERTAITSPLFPLPTGFFWAGPAPAASWPSSAGWGRRFWPSSPRLRWPRRQVKWLLTTRKAKSSVRPAGIL
jgi:hypothetical protein